MAKYRVYFPSNEDGGMEGIAEHSAEEIGIKDGCLLFIGGLEGYAYPIKWAYAPGRWAWVRRIEE